MEEEVLSSWVGKRRLYEGDEIQAERKKKKCLEGKDRFLKNEYPFLIEV